MECSGDENWERNTLVLKDRDSLRNEPQGNPQRAVIRTRTRARTREIADDRIYLFYLV